MILLSQVTLRKICSGGLVVWQEIADLKVTGSNPVPSLFLVFFCLVSHSFPFRINQVLFFPKRIDFPSS
jgi:hypothetical protein